ncbi:MAG: hypothetical protein CM15mP25_4390 [Gammaproteobacteria bacterium]|nr:MAG: hypothetical protein CM15mP25_4390 [Gammaproteobacteria bacterium]
MIRIEKDSTRSHNLCQTLTTVPRRRPQIALDPVAKANLIFRGGAKDESEVSTSPRPPPPPKTQKAQASPCPNKNPPLSGFAEPIAGDKAKGALGSTAKQQGQAGAQRGPSIPKRAA